MKESPEKKKQKTSGAATNRQPLSETKVPQQTKVPVSMLGGVPTTPNVSIAQVQKNAITPQAAQAY